MSAPLSACLEAERLLEAIYDSPNGGAGCCWHIVLDDNNIDDHSIAFCIDNAARHGHPDCIAIGPLLAEMSRTQRGKLRVRGYAKGVRYEDETKGTNR